MLEKAEGLYARSAREIIPGILFLDVIMKNLSQYSIKFISAIILGFVLLLSACNKDKPAANVLDKDTSYAFGMLLASQLNGSGITDLHFDYDAFKEGFKAFNEATETRLTPEVAMEKINAALNKMQEFQNEQMWADGMRNLEEGDAFLEENKNKPGVITQPSGLQYEILSQGDGKKPDTTNTVRVHYEGALLDGTVFDSSYVRGEPVEFGVTQVIPGWTEGLQLMNEGSIFRFVIPSDLAYGMGGSGPIPPNSTLVFLVELLEVK